MAMALSIACSHGPVSIGCRAVMGVPYSNRVKSKIRCSSSDIEKERRNQPQKRCLRCNNFYVDAHNSTTACSFHGHTTGEKGLFALAPPHQGVDGEWSDLSGVIVYRWNEKSDRPNTGRANWKRRWSCCAEYDENAPPCRRGQHVSYDDGFTLY
ncbi:uncharacterized protein LOC115729045 [Rhodamnia argentea]|uniref:Uncharacterized protein LOC115729045 n=1 Tax=Rhodamnia argentea TaxID=178133 RepID=A0A8B8MYW7_9MYRT|nr:uncharacterized protein LOC115729045 [Rhodamnia argentea]